MSENKKNIVIAVVAVLLMGGIVFSWAMNELFGGEVVDVSPDSEMAVEPNNGLLAGSDPLITPASRVYESMVREDDPIRGEKGAKLLILEFGDFECPYCAQVYPELAKILNEYQGEVRLVWKDFINPVHLNARSAAMAARCAHEQGSFWEYHDYLFTNQDSLSRELYNEIALELKLDLASFNKCLEGEEKIDLIGQGMDDGQRLGVDATPYLFIGNRGFDYALSYSELKSVVESELKIAR